MFSTLYPGSQFKGKQQSKRSNYSVSVTIQDVDLQNSFICGYLSISGLADEFPVLTTFFEGEIIGKKHSFLTRKWDATLQTDYDHWIQFKHFDIKKNFNKDGFIDIEEEKEQAVYFMRWKEYFLVPDHRITNISGASYDGFYYICFEKYVGKITGYYFHRTSERFQYLEMFHIPDRCFASFDFR